MKRKILSLIVIVFSITVMGSFVNFHQAEAAEMKNTTTIIPKSNFLPGPTVKEQKDNPGLKKAFGEEILPRIGLNLIGFVGAASLLFVVISGVRFVTAYGDEEAVGNAKQQLTYALVGFLLSLLAVTIVTIVNNINFQGNDTQQVETTTTTTPTEPAK